MLSNLPPRLLLLVKKLCHAVDVFAGYKIQNKSPNEKRLKQKISDMSQKQDHASASR